MSLQALSPNLWVYADACRVYAVRSGDTAVLVDFGSGDIVPLLAEAGIHRVSDVLITHHHRDQVQGLALAAQMGARIWAPYNEQDLFLNADRQTDAREIYLNYNMRQDRFGPLSNVALDGLLEDYAVYEFGDRAWQVVPAPGHTPGSIALVVEVDGRRLAFSGDLLHSPGKLWSLAATQWTYNGGEGLPYTVCSLLDLKERRAEVLLPSHGAPIDAVDEAVELTVARLGELMRARGQNPRLFPMIEDPYTAITPHLLRSRLNLANTFVLRSESGKSLWIDFGYGFTPGVASGSDRAARRPWLFSLSTLKRKFAIRQVDVVLPTHYHDDHVAGINLLRRVEHARSWIPRNFADILADPARSDLPCLWYDPIAADRIVPLEEDLPWEEYTLRLHPLPGHTRFAVAIEFMVDGTRVLAVGDQHQNDDGLAWNYVYRNRFSPGDYRQTADLYARLQPQLILSGHWEPLWVKPGYFELLQQRATELERLHADLLPLEIEGFGPEGFGARLEPYQVTARGGQPFEITAEIYNPVRARAQAAISLLVPSGWVVAPALETLQLAPLAGAQVHFQVTAPAGETAYRRRIALEMSIDGQRYGQQAEALVTLRKD